MGFPEVSIVITIYREGELLRDTVESALGQSFEDLEILLVDNNADAATQGVAKEFASRFPKSVRIVSEPVQGICSAKNRGIIDSRGRFVAFLDGDDIADPRRIALQRELFLGTPGLSLVSARYDRVSMDNRTVVRKDVSATEPRIWFETQEILKGLFPVGPTSGTGESLHFPLPSTYFFKRETALLVGGFDTRLNPRWFEDQEFSMRMYTMGEFAKVPLSLVRYRIASPEQLAVKRCQMDWVGFCRHMDRFYQILWERFGGPSEETKRIFRKLAALWLRHESLNILRYRQGKEIGVRMLDRALRSDPGALDSWKLRLKAVLPREFYPRLFWFDALASGSLPAGASMELANSIFRLKE